MMKFLVAIAMVALIGRSLTSAAAVDFSDDNNVGPGEMEGFKANLQSMLQQVSEQIKEDSDFKDESDVERFLQEIDAEQNSVLTEEEEEELANDGLSDAEDDKSGENVESGIRCRWRGRTGRCCQRVRIIRYRISICLAAQILPPAHMRIALLINGRAIWGHTVGTRRRYTICKRYSAVHLCLRIYNIYISPHSARACLQVAARFHFIRIRKRLGCFSRHYAADEIAITKEETPRQLLEKEEENNNLLFVQNKNKKPISDVFTFHQ